MAIEPEIPAKPYDVSLSQEEWGRLVRLYAVDATEDLIRESAEDLRISRLSSPMGACRCGGVHLMNCHYTRRHATHRYRARSAVLAMREG